MGNLYFSLVNKNYAIIHKWWYYQQGKCRFNMDSPFMGSWGGNGCLFMDIKDLMSSSCQRGDPCPVLLKFELLINLSTFNSNQSPSVNCNNLDSCILCDNHLSPVLEFKIPHVRLAIMRLHEVQPNRSVLVVKCIAVVYYYIVSKGLSHA